MRFVPPHDLAQKLPREHERDGGHGAVGPAPAIVRVGLLVEKPARPDFDREAGERIDALGVPDHATSSQVPSMILCSSAVAFGFSETRPVSANVAALKRRQPVLSPQSQAGSSHCLSTSAIFCTPMTWFRYICMIAASARASVSAVER